MQKVFEYNRPDRTADFSEALAYGREFVDQVIRAQEQMSTKQFYAKVVLTFSKPTELYYGRRRGNEVATVHTVKSLFPNGGLCYMAPAMKSKGRRVPMYDLVSVTLTAMYKDYSKEWAAIARSMRKHNLNPSLAASIEAMVAGDEERLRGAAQHWDIHRKPRTTSFADVTRKQTLEEMWAERETRNVGDNERTYFARVKRARRMNRGRDRRVSLQKSADDSDYPGAWYFSAASEYEGCGNGSYYLMYSPTRALYLEDD